MAWIRQDKKLSSKDLLSSKDPDIFILRPDPTISIDAVRNLKSMLKLKPYAAKCKIALFISAQLLTIPAQHALLKTLEEPMPNTYLILELNNPHQLLPTIRSRCQIIKAPRIEKTHKKLADQQAKSIISLLQQKSPAVRIACLEKFKNRAEAQKLLDTLLPYLRKKMRQNPRWAPTVKLTQEAIESLKNNVNTNLTLEYLALNFPRSPNA